ncbi:MAG TPA: preprotein translocase subunit SecA [Candidatus Coproplasma avistercoris]|nr:preprotein translocase subunit SecA [Candidatus Coproplasma avistercoris]
MGLISYILGSDSRAAVKKLNKLAVKVEELEPKYQSMSDEQLKDQTRVLKERLAKGETLDDIMFDAFAALREASWRVLKMKHFHVQIMGGICLHQGRIAEMRTGEGKTLVSTLPAYLNALTGKGVHIVTVNDYLARRDAEWMGKVHKFMGLTVGVVVPGMDDRQKKEAYACDIVYGTNNELGFDYLRDNLKVSLASMVQRELNFCIIDEVDSILIDEARTPLIISGRGGESSRLYEDVDRFVRTLTGGFDDDKKDAEKKAPSRRKKELTAEEQEANARLAAILEEMENWDYIIDRKEKSVTITEKGAEKAERFFGIANLADIENADLNHHIQQALKAHELFKRDEDYIVSNDGEILIVDEFTGRLMNGRRYSDGLHQAIEAKEHVKVRNENKTHATVTFQNYFRLYNKLSGMTGTAKTEEAEFRTIYSLDVVEIPTNKPVQRKDYADMIYSTEDGKKRAIVNEIVERHAKGQPILIGTVTVDKSEELSRLLHRNGVKHNILNAKNHEREAEIVAQAGRYGAVTIATNMAGRGTDILLGGNPEYLAKKRMREEGFDHDMIEVAISYADREFNEEEIKARERYAELYAKFKAETDAEKVKVIEAGGLCIIGTERHESRRIDNQLRGRSGRQGDPGVSIFYISLEDDLAKRFGGERIKSIYNAFKLDEDQCLQSKMLSRAIENAQKAIEGRNFAIRKRTLQYDEVMNEQRKTIYGERLKVLKGEDVHEQMLKYIPDYIEKVVGETVNTEAMPEKWDEDALNEALKTRIYPDECTFTITRDMLERWDYQKAINKISKEVIAAYEQKIVNIKNETHGQVDYHQIERNELLRSVDRNWIDHIDAMDQLRKGIGLRGYAQQDPVIAYKQEGYEMFTDMIDRVQTTTISRLLKGRIVRVRPGQQPGRPAPAARPAAPAQAPAGEKSEAPEKAEGDTAPAAQSVPAARSAPAGPVNMQAASAGGLAMRPQEFTPNPVGPQAPLVRGKKKEPGRNDPCPCGSGKKYKDCCYWKDHR